MRFIQSTVVTFMMLVLLQVTLMAMATRTAHAAPLSTGGAVNGDIFTDSHQALGNSNSRAVAFGDVDGDGDTDAFVANNGPDKLWLNNGAGLFIDSGQSFPTSNSTDVALGDLDGDGDLDAFVTTASVSEIWLNDGSGFFNNGLNISALPPVAVVLGDVDGDGDLDAFVGYEYDGIEFYEVLWNDGAGSFTYGDQYLGALQSVFLSLGDVDGDGDLDAFVANQGANKVWLNDGNGIYSDSGQNLGNSNSLSVSLGDVDGDGDLDAVVGDGVNGTSVWLNDGAGAYMDSQRLGNGPGGFVDLGDVDGDDDLDLLIATGCCTETNVTGNDDSGALTTSDCCQLSNEVWLNDGTGIFSHNGEWLDVPHARGLLEDLDSDGDLDAFFAGSGPNKVWLNQTPHIHIPTNFVPGELLLTGDPSEVSQVVSSLPNLQYLEGFTFTTSSSTTLIIAKYEITDMQPVTVMLDLINAKAVGSGLDVKTEPNYFIAASGHYIHGSTDIPPNQSVDRKYFKKQEIWNDIGLSGNQGYTGSEIPVAVFDNSTFPEGESDQPYIKTLNGRPLSVWHLKEPTDASARGGIVEGHGYSVASLISEIAPGAELHLFRVLNEYGIGELFDLNYAIRAFIDRYDGPGVINLSLGVLSDSVKYPEIPLLEDLLKEAEEDGFVVVAAAGNWSDIMTGTRVIGPTQAPAAFSSVLST